MKINYLVGDATLPATAGKKLICHICNDVGGWGAGFVLALNKRFGTLPMEQYKEWSGYFELKGPAPVLKTVYKSGEFKLGQIQTVAVGKDVTVVNMIAQADVAPVCELPPIRYQSLQECLIRLRELIKPHLKKGVTLHIPRIGCGLAGGTWDKIEQVIKDVFGKVDVDIYVYDLK